MSAAMHDPKRSRWIPWVFVGGMTLVVMVNLVLVYFAVSTFTRVTVPRSYERGRGYDTVLAEAARQDALGWQAEVALAGGALRVAATDREGRPVHGRLDGVLRSRGTHGVMILPSWFQPDVRALDWTRLAGIYTDYVTSQPALHVVCLDHYASMYTLLRRLHGRGYRRPGYILEEQRSARIQHRQRAAYHAFTEVNRDVERVEVAVTPEAPRREEFIRWFRAEKPDVVITHAAAVQDWIDEEVGGEETGFVLLNRVDCVRPCACLDQQPHVLGARALEMVAGQVLCGVYGPPERATRTQLEARWIEGPSVRPPDGPDAMDGDAQPDEADLVAR